MPDFTDFLADFSSLPEKLIDRDYKNSYHSIDNRFVIIERLQQRIPLLLEEAEVQSEQIIAVGISDASFIDTKDRISVFNRYIPKWEDVPIGSILSRIIPVQTFLERDAAVTALAETQLTGTKKITNALCISLRHGISLGILINNRIYTGQTGNAGEWSVMNLFRDSKHTGDSLDLDTLLGISTLRKIFDKRIFSGRKAAETKSGTDEVIIKKLFSAYENGSEGIKSDVEEYIKLMAIHMANLIFIFDIEIIIIAGHFSHCGEKFRINLEKQTSNHLRKFRKITIIRGKLGAEGAVLGAAQMAQEKILNPSSEAVL